MSKTPTFIAKGNTDNSAIVSLRVDRSCKLGGYREITYTVGDEWKHSKGFIMRVVRLDMVPTATPKKYRWKIFLDPVSEGGRKSSLHVESMIAEYTPYKVSIQPVTKDKESKSNVSDDEGEPTQDDVWDCLEAAAMRISGISNYLAALDKRLRCQPNRQDPMPPRPEFWDNK